MQTTELRLEVFGFLDATSVARCQVVCSDWRETASESSVWTYLCSSDFAAARPCIGLMRPQDLYKSFATHRTLADVWYDDEPPKKTRFRIIAVVDGNVVGTLKPSQYDNKVVDPDRYWVPCCDSGFEASLFDLTDEPMAHLSLQIWCLDEETRNCVLLVEDQRPSWCTICTDNPRMAKYLQRGDLLCFGHSFRYLGAYATMGAYDPTRDDEGRYMSGYMHFRKNGDIFELVRVQLLVMTLNSEFCRDQAYLERCLWRACNSAKPPFSKSHLRQLYKPHNGIDDITASVFL
ncbi:hypothetical protein CTAYLR_002761 [Chrysophaeum taylorii]|uniref:F-box domain-containing protein n=1 Tax=Chrysophaeum taylorii TaxID=2483200 RepID=A0AAD7XJT4_9STRA|nr:hypothetical protein CTAYLR_002761 [Chrysophaeum taylorii]